jgi:hypothetical protein
MPVHRYDQPLFAKSRASPVPRFIFARRPEKFATRKRTRRYVIWGMRYDPPGGTMLTTGRVTRKEKPHVSEQQNRDALERYIEAIEHQDFDAMTELVHEDYVEEYPQSGERIRGKQNARSILQNYPSLPSVIEHSYVLSGDLGVMKLTLDYDGQRIYACEVIDFEDGKVKRARGYFAEPFEAPEWRARWVEKM